MKAMLRQRLIDCGWRDELKEYCKEVIKNKGLEKITVDELVKEITPRGRGTMTDAAACAYRAHATVFSPSCMEPQPATRVRTSLSSCARSRKSRIIATNQAVSAVWLRLVC